MRVSELYTEIGQLLNDPNNQRWSQAVLLSRINIAQTKVIAYTTAIREPHDYSPGVGASGITVADSAIDIIRVDIERPSGEIVKLRGYLRDQLDFEFPNWQQWADGEPILYWWDGTTQEIKLVPSPDAANALPNCVRVWEVRNPDALTGSTEMPFASNTAMVPYHMALAYWVTAQCFMDDATPEALAKSRFHRSELMDRPGNFEREIMQINAKFDSPRDIPVRILWRPEGGRASKNGIIAKASPFG